MADRRTRRAVGSPLLTAITLVLVAIPGFALGLVAGVAWQDPSLLASHLVGNTEEVVWSAPALESEPRAAESVASALANLPAVAAPAEPTLPPPPPKATPARLEAAAPPAPAGRFAVQVGAFGESATAERLAEKLRAKGFAVYVSPGAAAGAARWRVRVGPLPSRREAEEVSGALKRREKLPTWVLDEDGAV